MAGYQNEYTDVRGFNFQPPWGSNGRDIWLNFDETEYRRLIRCAKKNFPKLNTFRIWLGFEAWYENQNLFMQNLQKAVKVIQEEGLKIIPIYFNGWRAMPDFGGAVYANALRAPTIQKTCRMFLREVCVELEKSGTVLMTDVCNEPFNDVRDSVVDLGVMIRFLEDMADDLHELTTAPVTVGVQGDFYFTKPLHGHMTDLSYVEHFCDVISVHPYAVGICTDPNMHEDWVKKMIEEAQMYGKPILATEVTWDAETEEEREKLIRLELEHYVKYGIGFLAHALCPSGVADLHPRDGKNPGFYMPYMLLDGSIRPHHECFNDY